MTNPCHCTTLRRLAALSTDRYDAALAPAGIKVTMFRLLRRIDGAGWDTISDLADQLGLDRSTLGRNLRVLEKRGLITMGIGRDARARPVALTDQGRDTLHRALPLWQAAQDDFAILLGPQAIALLDDLSGLLPSETPPETLTSETLTKDTPT